MAHPEPATPECSIVIPVFNEADNLRRLYAEICEVMEKTNPSFECIFVDDGSTDGSYDLLKALHAQDSRVRVIRFARNFGQTPALYAGFAHARGQILIMLDADLQNPPTEIPKLLAKIQEGYDAVHGYRAQRQDSFLRRMLSSAVRFVIQRAMDLPFSDLGTGLRAYKPNVVQQLFLSKQPSRYFAAEIAWLGVRVCEIPVEHRPREAGESKYSLFRLLRAYFDLITTLSSAPVYIVGVTGAVLSFIGFAMAVRIAVLRIFWGHFSDMATVSALFFVLSGFQLMAVGLMAIYVSRIYERVQQRPFYIIDEILE